MTDPPQEHLQWRGLIFPTKPLSDHRTCPVPPNEADIVLEEERREHKAASLRYHLSVHIRDEIAYDDLGDVHLAFEVHFRGGHL